MRPHEGAVNLLARSFVAMAVVFIAVVLTAGATNPPNCPTSGHPGFRLSKISTNLCFQDLHNKYRHLFIPAPDRSVALAVDGYKGEFVKNGKILGQPFDVAEDEEIVWSPDSKAIMATFGLGTDLFSTDLAYVDPKRTKIPDITASIQKDSALHHPCVTSSQSVPVLGLTWQKDSRQAVLVAVLPGSCAGADATDNFDAYVIAIPGGAILGRYPQIVAQKKWHKVMLPP